jgi:hypothetical protein
MSDTGCRRASFGILWRQSIESIEDAFAEQAILQHACSEPRVIVRRIMAQSFANQVDLETHAAVSVSICTTTWPTDSWFLWGFSRRTWMFSGFESEECDLQYNGAKLTRVPSRIRQESCALSILQCSPFESQDTGMCDMHDHYAA